MALFGDLTPALADDSDLLVGHRLESVKILEQPGGNQGESYGDLTSEAVARVEVTAIDRRRVFSMSVTATDGRDRGRPSSWSSTIDGLSPFTTTSATWARDWPFEHEQSVRGSDWVS